VGRILKKSVTMTELPPICQLTLWIRRIGKTIYNGIRMRSGSTFLERIAAQGDAVVKVSRFGI